MNFTTDRIIVLHEYGAKGHFRALEKLLKSKYHGEISLCYHEFSFFRFMRKSIKRLKGKRFIREWGNLFFMISLLFRKPEVIILGMAPYDYKMWLMRPFLARHKVIYFTSWPYWDYSNYPKKKYATTGPVKNAWRYFFEEKVEGICSVTATGRQNLLKNYAITKDIEVVYHSFNNEREADLSAKPADCLRALFVGRFEDKKGIEDILTLAEHYHGSEKRVEFLFVGDGKQESLIREKAKECSNIELIGYVSDQERLKDIYASSHVLLLPSKKVGHWEELFGMVIVEARSAGLVPVVSDHVGPTEQVQDGEDGFIFPEEGYISGTVGVLDRLYADRDYFNTLAEASLERVKAFDIDVLMLKWDKVLKPCLEKAKE